MDSVTVIMGSTGLGFWSTVVEIVKLLAPMIVGTTIAWLTIRNTDRWKERELERAEADRVFQVKKVVAEHTLEVLSKSYRFAHTLNFSLNVFGSANEEGKRRILEQLQEARNYWEENLFYLPASIRPQIIPLTNFAFASLNPNHPELSMEAFQRISTIMTDIECAFAELMREYNPFDGLREASATSDNQRRTASMRPS